MVRCKKNLQPTAVPPHAQVTGARLYEPGGGNSVRIPRSQMDRRRGQAFVTPHEILALQLACLTSMTTASFRSPRCTAVRLFFMVAALFVADFTDKGASANAPCCLRPGDELWEVSTRCLPDLQPCVSVSTVTFQVSQCTGQGWHTSDQDQLQASFVAAPFMRTVIYAHGNWMTADNARDRGTYVYQRVSQRAAEPVRFIIYSWPSQRDGRPVRDLYDKVERSDVDAVYFAHLLLRIPEQTPIGLMGFSFGARVVCGALHLVNGGQFEGRRSPVWPTERHLHISLLAPAFDRGWLAQGQPYGLAMNGMHSLVNIYNSRDPALRRFRFLDRVSAPIAAGFTGLADPRSTQPLQADVRIRQFDCGPDVGTSHDEMTYYQECCAFIVALDNALGR